MQKFIHCSDTGDYHIAYYCALEHDTNGLYIARYYCSFLSEHQDYAEGNPTKTEVLHFSSQLTK